MRNLLVMNARVSIQAILILAGGAVVSTGVFLFGESPTETGEFVPNHLPFIAAVSYLLVVGGIWKIRTGKAGNGRQGKKDGMGTDFPEGSTVAAALIALTATGLSLRVANLGNYGYCNDEILFVTASSHGTVGEVLRDCLVHFHPPTNFVVIHYLLQLSWDPLIIRLPAVIGGTLAISCAYLFVRTLFGPLAGLIASFLVTFSPSLILLSQVSRNYSPSMPFFLIALYYLARYLKEGQLRHLFGFAAFEFLSVIWHYAYLPAFLGANLVIFGTLIHRRRGWYEWTATVLAQVPVGIVYLLAVLVHRPLTHIDTQVKILNYMRTEYFVDPSNPLKPLLDLFQYLFAGGGSQGSYLLGTLSLLVALAAGASLWRRGHQRFILLCLSFLPFSLIFAFGMHLLPFGGTRHVFYAFPYLFAIVSGGVAVWIKSPFFERDVHCEGGEDPSKSPEFTGTVRIVALLMAALFLVVNLRSYANVMPYYLRQSPAYFENTPYYKPGYYRLPELPTRTRDLEGLVQALQKYSAPGETVLASFTVFLILNAHLLEQPESYVFDLHQRYEFDWQGRRMLYLPEAQFGFTPDSLLVTAAATAVREGLRDTDRLWVALAGWEVWPHSLHEWTSREYPDFVPESDAVKDSRDTLFPVVVGPARTLSAGALDIGVPASSGESNRGVSFSAGDAH